MKKLTNLLIALTAGIGTLNAGVVPTNVAQKVATNFYGMNTNKIATTLTLVHQENDAAGNALYYVYNVNQADGWVIISAEDAARPIIGYSDHGQYVEPAPHSNFDFWMNYRKNELIHIRTYSNQIVPLVSNEWMAYINNTRPIGNNTKKVQVATGPLCQSTWDQQYQPYPYNYFCPPNTKGLVTTSGQSVTGCVATAMAQIMRYWSYPAKGTGSHSYCDCSSSGYTDNWGTLSANFAHTYNWSAMTLSPATTSKVTTADTDIARLMSDCGISVEMDYDPNGSGAFVLSSEAGGGNAACAQYSYATYFGYQKDLHGIQYSSAKSEAAWIDSLEKEFTNKRIIQYEGQASDGGHTWVCDGNDATSPYNNVHMNWGWSGYDDGFFAVTNLDPDNSMPAFNTDLAALIYIQPPSSPTSVVDIAPETNVSVYPNPSNGSFTFELNNVQNKQQLAVFNMLGQNVYNTELNEGKTQVNFTQTSGIYFYRILSVEGNVTSTGKLIVK
jgi:hypothetical protein